jgi:tRNA-2-methylthio-N6-dimethylallyladenosine synthase
MKYHIWTEGCQMNVSDSQRVGSALEHLGYAHTESAEEADVIVLNTCVVRQSAEDKAYGRLSSFKPLKQKNPNLVINLMGAWWACAETKSCARDSPMWMSSPRPPTRGRWSRT